MSSQYKPRLAHAIHLIAVTGLAVGLMAYVNMRTCEGRRVRCCEMLALGRHVSERKDSELNGDTYIEVLRVMFAHTYIRKVTLQVHHNEGNRLITNAHFTKMFS